MRRIWAIMIVVFVFINIMGFYSIEFENAGGEITILGGHITTDTTWYLSQSPYYIEGNVTVDENVTLTIEPGVNVKFNMGCGLYVDGILNAVGLQDKMINFTSNMSTPSIGDWDRIQINSTGNINIIYCNITYADYGLYLSNTSNNNITNNDIYKNRLYGIYLNNSFYNRLESNRISYNNFRSIYINLSSFNEIIDNDIYQTGGKSGITLSSSSNNYIERNNIYSNGHYGIYLKFSSNNTIIKNNLSSNLDENIYIYFSNNNLIMKNDVYNSPIGIDIASSSYNNVINNKVYSNYQIGIFVTTSSYNNITNNNLSNNDLGTWMRTNSHYNRIYHNNFFNNTNQAIDEEDDNFWNNSYPTGGNYWSDYNGTDLNSTPTQDIPPPDGIGDTPYVIDTDSQDNYPLMEPYGQTPPSAPQNLQTITGNSFVNLTWEPPFFNGGSQITGYNIYRNGTMGIYDFIPADQIWYNDSNVVNGIEYFYNVSAINNIGEGPNATISAIPMTTPTAPRNPGVAGGYGYVNISWDLPISDGGSMIVEYKIYRNGTVGQYASVPAGQLWYNDTAVVNGTSYTYNVTALNGIGKSPPSNNIIGTTPAPSPPSEPLNPTTESGNGYVNLSWDTPILDGDSTIFAYNIYRNGTIGIYDTVSASQLWFNDTNVTNYINYTYNITALNAVGEGPHSLDVPATPSFPTVPQPPENLQAEEGDGYVNLTWEIPSNDGNSPITGYYIYRNGTTGSFASVPAGQLWYLDTDVINDITYTYNVSAINGIGEGPSSPDVWATSFNMTVPSEPLDLQAQVGDSFINLSWLSPIDDGGTLITIYKIYRNDTSGIYNTVSYDQLWFLDTNVINGIIYNYRVAAENMIGEGPLSTPIDGKAGTFPSPPTNVMAASGDSFVILTWNISVSDGGYSVTSYIIYRGGSPEDEIMLAQVGNILFYNDSSVIDGVMYYYKISAVNGIGEGEFSATVNAMPNAADTTPNQPPNCSITSPPSGSYLHGIVMIKGQASDSDGSIQKVEIRIGESNWMLAEGTTSWNYSLDTASFANGEHIIFARAYDESNFSSETSISIQINNPLPEVSDNSLFEESWFWILVVMVIIVLLIIFLFTRRKKEEPKEEGEARFERETDLEEEVNETPEDAGLEEDVGGDIEDE